MATASPSPAQGSRSTCRSLDFGILKSTKEAKLGRRCLGAGKYPPRAMDSGRAMLDDLGKLFLGKVLGRLAGQELGEDFGGDVAHHRRLETDAGEALGEERPRVAHGPFG